jgi:hypothetical protein
LARNEAGPVGAPVGATNTERGADTTETMARGAEGTSGLSAEVEDDKTGGLAAVAEAAWRGWKDKCEGVWRAAVGVDDTAGDLCAVEVAVPTAEEGTCSGAPLFVAMVLGFLVTDSLGFGSDRAVVVNGTPSGCGWIRSCSIRRPWCPPHAFTISCLIRKAAGLGGSTDFQVTRGDGDGPRRSRDNILGETSSRLTCSVGAPETKDRAVEAGSGGCATACYAFG